jgi:hypothetical protein
MGIAPGRVAPDLPFLGVTIQHQGATRYSWRLPPKVESHCAVRSAGTRGPRDGAGGPHERRHERRHARPARRRGRARETARAA